MQEEDKEFDLKIRSILKDGQEEVPDYLWEAVEGRLSEKKKRPVLIWLRRSAIAVAASAAAAAFFFIGLDLYDSTRHHPAQTPDLSADAGIQVIGKASRPGDGAISSGRDISDGDLSSGRAAHTVATGLLAEARPAEVRGHDMSVDDRTAGLPETTEVAEAGSVPETAGKTETAAGAETGDKTETESNAEMETEDKAEKEAEHVEEPPRATHHTSADRSAAASEWGDDVLDADVDAAKRKIPVAMTISGNAISNSTDGKTVQSLAPMQSSGIPPANSLHEDMATSYGIPLSFGAGVKVFFNRRWALGAGVNYSLLNRTLSGIYYDENGAPFSDSDIMNSQSYIGIPVNVYCSILKKDFIDLYAYAGGTVEKCVSSSYLIDAPGYTITYREAGSGVQLSADLGIGVEFLVADRLGIYIDPSLRYYFKSRQPKSIRTVQPLMIGFEAGLRIRL